MRVTLAEDSALLREGLVRLLADEGHHVVAAVGDADALLAAVAADRPDLVVADVRMPPTHTDEGLRAAVEIRQRWPDVGVLVLSQYVEKRYAADLLGGDRRRRRLSAQGPGRPGRPTSWTRWRGLPTARQWWTPRWYASCWPGRRTPTRSARLTPRERDVLDLMAQGYANARISRSAVRLAQCRGEARQRDLRQARADRRHRLQPAGAGGGPLPRRLSAPRLRRSPPAPGSGSSRRSPRPTRR